MAKDTTTATAGADAPTSTKERTFAEHAFAEFKKSRPGLISGASKDDVTAATRYCTGLAEATLARARGEDPGAEALKALRKLRAALPDKIARNLEDVVGGLLGAAANEVAGLAQVQDAPAKAAG